MLKCTKLFNAETATQFGKIRFDEKGENRGLTEDQEKYLAERVHDFEFVDEAEPEVIVAEEVAEVEAEPVEEKAPAKKRAPRKKAEEPKE